MAVIQWQSYIECHRGNSANNKENTSSSTHKIQALIVDMNGRTKRQQINGALWE